MIRVALIDMRPKLRSLIGEALAREPDMELIECRGERLDIVATEPDVIIGEIADPLDGDVPERLLRAVPHGRVLMVAETGNLAALYELRPKRRVLRNVSMIEVIQAIRLGLR